MHTVEHIFDELPGWARAASHPNEPESAVLSRPKNHISAIKSCECSRDMRPPQIGNIAADKHDWTRR